MLGGFGFLWLNISGSIVRESLAAFSCLFRASCASYSGRRRTLPLLLTRIRCNCAWSPAPRITAFTLLATDGLQHTTRCLLVLPYRDQFFFFFHETGLFDT